MAQIDQLHQLLTRMARNRAGYVLDVATVERVCNRWCDKHNYRDWMMRRCLFGHDDFAVWMFDEEYGRGHAWHRQYATMDVPLEPPVLLCMFCDGPIWRDYPRRCDKKLCRAVYAFFYRGRHWPRSTPYGGGMGAFLLADFLKRMSMPKSQREREFSKRYAHRIR